jgi:outer membrane protein assembly factor BamB
MDPDGKLVWSSGQTERYGLGPFLIADDKIFILNDNGIMTVIKASVEGFEKLAERRVVPGHDAWGPMALVDGKLLVRDSKFMLCLDVRAH